MSRRAVFHDAGSFDDGSPITSFPSAVASVFGRTGTVVAAAGDYFGAMPAALTGATQAARFVGATTSGAPVSGTFAVGDVVVARDGKVWVCTSAGTPGTWVDVAGGASVSYATPAIALGTAAAAGSASTVIRSDSTIVAFDATVPTTQAFGDAAATGAAAVAARRDHKHAMPAAPTTIANDTIWAAAGDLAVATGNDAATVLAKGSAGGVLAMANGAVTWNAGSSFPGSPATGDRYFRTDILGGTEFKYDGTRWRSMETLHLTMPVVDAAMSSGITVDTSNICRLVIPWRSTYGFYALTLHAHTIVLTTNNGTNFWTATFYQVGSAGTVTTSSTFTTAADTVTTHTYHALALNAVVSSTDVYFQMGVAKTLSPGAIFIDGIITGQLIAT